ncbi:MAG TPA: FtsX-like permease family protein, partial [Blastocatellia bacterium]|nr:FtsX-like permease family protein [Blastocatellia bacterium]
LTILARYASRFSVRALDLTLDYSMIWVAVLLAVIVSILLAFVPRLPSGDGSNGISLASGGLRITRNTARRQRIFAVTQIAASFMLLAGASMLIKTLLSLQAAEIGFETRQVLAINVPVMSYGKTDQQVVDFYREAIRRVGELPGVDRVAVGLMVPWRDAGTIGPEFQFSADGQVRASGEEDPRGRYRVISPGFFDALGVKLIAGRDFNDNDRKGSESVVIVSQSLAQRMFPNQEAVNRHIMWTDPVMKFVGITTDPRRVVGVVADIDDENVVPGPAMTVYNALGQEELFGGRLFIHAHGNPYTLVSPITRIIRDMSADQVVERAATLEDVRAEVLTPDRLNAVVFGVFAAAALVIAIVGVAGVLAFSVSGRIREFAIRLAVGARPRVVLMGVLSEGVIIAVSGVVAGAAGGFALAKLIGSYFEEMQLPGAAPIIGSAFILLAAAVIASALPAIRAARVDVTQALRSE